MAAKRGRSPYSMSVEHRDKIKNSNILNALISHAEGIREMSPSQVTAGLGLMRKVLPDLQAIQHSGDENNPIRTRLEYVIVDAANPGRKSVPPASGAE